MVTKVYVCSKKKKMTSNETNHLFKLEGRDDNNNIHTHAVLSVKPHIHDPA